MTIREILAIIADEAKLADELQTTFLPLELKESE